MKTILSGDAGATKTELALVRQANGNYTVTHSEKYSSKEYSSLEEIVKDFLNKNNLKINSACIGAPGPLINGKIISTNLPWILDQKILSGKLKIKNFKLINDLEALANSVELLKKDDLITLYKGKISKIKNNIAVIASGTGLGQAALIYEHHNKNYHIVPTEGGHADFAPDNDLEYGLYKFLKKRYDHVSWERVVSGMGIVSIFEYLLSTGKYKTGNELKERFRKGDKAAVISSEAKNGKSKICSDVMKIFISALGRQAGNMVMNFKATGGVYVGGNIPLENISLLKSKLFLKSYFNKGRLSYLTEMTPVYIINDRYPAIKGAAYVADSNND